MENLLLDKIKQNIFVPLVKYKKDFPEFLIPRLFAVNDKSNHSKISNHINNGLKTDKNLLILVYVPFCYHQCIFCRNKYFFPKKELIRKFISSLTKEIDLYAQLGIFRKSKVKAIYLGGGTPTVLSFQDINKILESINKNFNVDNDASITCETHPVFLNSQQGIDNLQKLKDCGINRISVGAQSLDDEVLKINKRGHTKRDVIEALENANRKNMFITLDMMIGLPGQHINSVRKDLDQLDKLKFDWVEYMRHDIVNDKAIKIIYENPKLLSDNGMLFEINMLVQSWLEKNAYERNGCFKENSKSFPYRAYWLKETPYVSFGPIAHSHLGGICFYNHSKMEDYIDSVEKNELPIKKYQILSSEEQIFRTLFLGLQTKAGVSIDELKSRFGENCYDILSKTISTLKSYKLIVENDKYLRLTKDYGRYFVEDISCFIVNEAEIVLSRLKKNV